MLFKNTASQKIAVLAIDTASNVPKTGDAANITVYVDKDWGGCGALTDTSATEIDATNAPGMYLFDVSQSETNADILLFTGKSSTSGVKIVPIVMGTRPPNMGALSISSAGVVDANITKFGGTNGTFSSGRPEVNTTHVGGTAQTAGDIYSKVKPEDSGTTLAVTSTTATLSSSTVTPMPGWAIKFTSGALSGFVSNYSSYNSGTRVLTFDPPATGISGTPTYELWAYPAVPTNDPIDVNLDSATVAKIDALVTGVNVTKVNSVTLQGVGTTGNPWRPA